MLAGLVAGSQEGLVLIGFSTLSLVPDSICVVGLSPEEFVVEARDPKERAFGERRSKYRR